MLQFKIFDSLLAIEYEKEQATLKLINRLRLRILLAYFQHISQSQFQEVL